MAKIRNIFLLILLIFCSFSIKAENNLQIQVFEEPQNQPWWQRAKFLPVHASIRGIPIHEIEGTWHVASELDKKAIPYELLFKDGSDMMEKEQLTFSRTGDFNNDGALDLGIVGVYEDCNVQLGGFFLILTKSKSDKWYVSFLKLLNEPHFAAISINGPVKIWLCMECNKGFDLHWDNIKKEYALKTFNNLTR